ncbi:MAG: hypothetical protein FWD89_00910 [Firmicutes bacterium]|nr:hypothetical protein [Bacillota bacterium]
MINKFLKTIFIGMLALIFPFILVACDVDDDSNPSVGTFYSLQDAYNEGLLTLDDIMHISYFKTGMVIEVIDDITLQEVIFPEWIYELPLWQYEMMFLPQNEWTVVRMVDFTPQFEIQELCPIITEEIKRTFFEAHRCHIEKAGGSIENIFVKNFWGEYNGKYVVDMASDLWEYGLGNYSVRVGKVFWEDMGPRTIVFSY